MITKLKQFGLMAFAMIILAACNKDELKQKATSVEIIGYNIGNSELEVSIDTVVYDKFRTAPNKVLDFQKIFTYPSSKEQAILKIKDILSGKEVYQQQIKLNNGNLKNFFPFVFLNGSALEIKSPPVDPSTNKMAFYIHYPQQNDAIDIYMKNDAGKTVYLARNATPGTWAYADYLTTEGFTDPNKSYILYFVKTGTTDQWAFEDDAFKSQHASNQLFIPLKGEKGRVQPYFVTPASNQLDVVSLFQY